MFVYIDNERKNCQYIIKFLNEAMHRGIFEIGVASAQTALHKGLKLKSHYHGKPFALEKE